MLDFPDWTHSRSAATHEAFKVVDDVEMTFVIMLTDRRRGLYHSELKKKGFDLFKYPGYEIEKAEFVKHAKTVKELKLFAESEFNIRSGFMIISRKTTGEQK